MSEQNQSPPPKKNSYIWYIIAAVALLIFVLYKFFPDSLSSRENKISLTHSLILLVFLASALFIRVKSNFLQSIKHVGIWFAIILLIIIGYSYRFELKDVKNRVIGELSPSTAITKYDGSIIFKISSNGHFNISTKVNGTSVDFLLDTGASDTVLSLDAAKRAGYNIDSLEFTKIYQTANGIVRAAPIIIDELIIGNYVIRNLKASVNQSPMDKSLLGMNFLNKMHKYEVSRETLTIWP